MNVRSYFISIDKYYSIIYLSIETCLMSTTTYSNTKVSLTSVVVPSITPVFISVGIVI